MLELNIQNFITFLNKSCEKLKETGLSKRSNENVGKYKYQPYRIQQPQELYDRDFQEKLDSLWFLKRSGEDKNFFNFVKFSADSTFHNNELVSGHNVHYYGDEIARFYRTNYRSQKQMVP